MYLAFLPRFPVKSTAAHSNVPLDLTLADFRLLALAVPDDAYDSAHSQDFDWFHLQNRLIAFRAHNHKVSFYP